MSAEAEKYMSLEQALAKVAKLLRLSQSSNPTWKVRLAEIGGCAMNLENVSRFCRLAASGSHPGASGGEKRCHALAKALQSIGDDVQLIDIEVVHGAGDLLKLMAGPFRTDADKQAIYAMLAKAAGK